MHNTTCNIAQQKRKVNSELDAISMQLCTMSAYPALPRKEKREVEYHSDRAAQEAALQLDLEKGERIAKHIAQVVERLRADFEAIKAHLGSYDFANTTGPDSDAGGDCSADLTAALDTRQAWKERLCCLLQQMRNYVSQQRLGGYSILHVPSSSSDCCPAAHREAFTFSAPHDDCLSRKVNTQVSNPDLGIDQLYALLCMPTQVEGETWPEGDEAWYTFLANIVSSAGSATEAEVALVDAGLPQALVDLIVHPADALLQSMGMPETPFVHLWHAGVVAPPLEYSHFIGSYNETYLPEGYRWSDMSALFPSLVPSTTGPAQAASIQTECDSTFAFVRQAIVEKMDLVRQLQLTNDSERKTLVHMRDTSECNQAYYEQKQSDATRVDQAELQQRQRAGEAMLRSLDALNTHHGVTKRTFLKKQ